MLDAVFQAAGAGEPMPLGVRVTEFEAWLAVVYHRSGCTPQQRLRFKTGPELRGLLQVSCQSSQVYCGRATSPVLQLQ